ncbi:MAG TPA: glycosyltransferase family 87 protein [Candidatus Binatia bacterium]|nr:glycosyltransferase family 87 protein [Candidatus Binatia bacterium]
MKKIGALLPHSVQAMPEGKSTFVAVYGLVLIIAWIVVGAANVAGKGDDWRIFWGAGHNVGSLALVTASHFAYTPGAAWLLWPFAHLPIATGYYIYVVLMTACATLAALLASKIYHLPFEVAALMALAWAPFTVAICLGQNSPVALLCVVIVIFAIVHNDQPLSGIGLGFLIYKPSDAIAIAFLLAIFRQWWALIIAGVFAIGWYLLSVSATRDWGWPIPYIQMLSTLYSRDAAMNSDFAISVPTFLMRFGISTPVAWLVGGTILFGSAPLLLRAPRLEAASWVPLIGVAASPHAWGYEAILALPAFWLTTVRLNKISLVLLILSYLAAPFYLFVRAIHFNVLALPVLGGVMLWVCIRIQSKGCRPVEHTGMTKASD